MRIVRVQDADGYDPDRFVAQPLIEGDQSNVRIIRLARGRGLKRNSAKLRVKSLRCT